MKNIVIIILGSFFTLFFCFCVIKERNEAEEKARLDASTKVRVQAQAKKQAAEAEATRKASPEYQAEMLQHRMKYTLRDSIRNHLKTTLVDYHGASNFEWSEPTKDGDNWKMRVVFRAANMRGGHATLDRTYTCNESGLVLSVSGL